jgi:hypothetical protein
LFNCFVVVDLENIIYLLRFLQCESVETEERSKNMMKIIKKLIESSVELREKIEQYLYSLKITIEQFQDIQLIVSSITTTSILLLVQKVELLTILMENAHELHSHEFFKQWFYSFLIGNKEVNKMNRREYTELLENWLDQFYKEHQIFIKILMDLDELVKAFQNEQYQSIFVKHIIIGCFQTGK